MRPALIATLFAGACTASSPPHWHVSDGQLRDLDDRAVIMRGVNLSGSQKSAPYLDDKTPADYARLRDAWGFNAIRFIMTWSAIEPAEGAYDDAYLAAVAERIGWANDAGLSVVLDMHEDVYGEGFGFDGAPRWTCDAARYAAFVPKDPWYLSTVDPNVEACVDDLYVSARRNQLVAAWRHAAQALAQTPGIVGFDVLNEPSWGSYAVFQFEHDRLVPLYADIVAAVRAEAPLWIAFLEPSSARNVGLGTKLAQPFDFADVMYAPHSYDNGAEGGGGFDPTHRQMILDNVAAMADEAKSLEAGLWIGEYGGSADAPGIVDYMTAEYDAAGAVAASTMYWAYDKSDGYGLLDPTGNEKPNLVGAVVRPYPERVAGTPTSYAFDAATSTFALAYRPAAGTTVISVPARVYPNGYRVDCGGCTSHADGATLVIDAPGDGTVTLTPM